MIKSVVCLLQAMVLWIAPTSLADTLVVHPDGSGTFPTIQAAVTAATDGDVVELSDGTYRGAGNRNVACYSKAITIRSATGDADQCVVDCESDCSTFRHGFDIRYLASGEVLIEGITVTNGCTEFGGGAVECGGGTQVRFIRCVFRNNRDTNAGEEGGGAVVCGSGSAAFDTCVFEDNQATHGGAVSGTSETDLTFERCTFLGNTASDLGGACYVTVGSAAHFNDCLFLGNAADDGGAVCAIWEGAVTLDHCTLAGNIGGGVIVLLDAQATMSHSIVAFNGSYAATCQEGLTVATTCSNVFGNDGNDWVWCLEGQFGVEGNISADPLFCDREVGDFRLYAGSPCAPDVNPGCGLIGALPVGCSTPIRETTWGAMKALFRGDAK